MPQQTRVRVFSREFKEAAVQRMIAVRVAALQMALARVNRAPARSSTIRIVGCNTLVPSRPRVSPSTGSSRA